MHQMQLSPPWTLLGNAVLKLQQKGTHHPLLQYSDPTHYFNHKCRNFSSMPPMWSNGALQERLSIGEEQWANRRSLNPEPCYSISSLSFGQYLSKLSSYLKLVQLESHLLRDLVCLGMLVLRILVFCSISYSQQ